MFIRQIVVSLHCRNVTTNVLHFYDTKIIIKM
nr:MAG TPA: hypothetical protein [Caudoviricetes sp.]